MKRIASIILSLCIFLVFVAGAWAGSPSTAEPSTGAAGVQWKAQWGGAATALAHAGDHAFIAVGPRLLSVNVADSADPQLRGASQPLLETIEDVTVAAGGDFVFAAAGYGGLVAYDVSGDVPVIVAELHPGGYLSGVAPAGNHLFAADLSGRLLKIDVTIPAQPALVDVVENVGQIAGVATAGSTVYLATGYAGLQVYDAGALSPLMTVPQPAWSVAVVDDQAVVGTDFAGGVQFYDVAEPNQPTAGAFLPTSGYVTGVAADAGTLYLAIEDGGVQIVDVADPDLPRTVNIIQLTGSTTDLAWHDGRLLALNESTGLSLFTFSAAGAPELQNVVEITGPILTVDVVGEVTLLGTGGRELVITDGAAGAVLSRMTVPGLLLGTAHSGSKVILALGDAGLAVIDMGEPAQPAVVTSWSTPGVARGVAVAGVTAYVAAGPAGLLIYDLSSMAAPQLVAEVSLPGDARDVVVRDGMAYVADWSGLQLVDVTDPAQPEMAGRFDTTGYAAALALFGELAYVADGQRVDVIDVSDPQRLAKVGQVVTPGLAGDVDVFGAMLAVADGSSGARLYRLGDGVALEPAGYYDTAGFTTAVTLQGDTLWLADREGGVTVVSVPTSHTLFLPVVVR